MKKGYNLPPAREREETALPGEGRAIEETFNQALGAVLREAAARWRAAPDAVRVEETRTLAGRGARGMRPDILVVEKGAPPVVVECSFDGADADADAIARLGRRTAQGGLEIKTAVAARIPPANRLRSQAEIRRALAGGELIHYALHQKIADGDAARRRWPLKGFLAGRVHDLAALLPAAALPREDVEEVAREVAELVDQAAGRLEWALSEAQQLEIAERVHQRTPLKGLRTTMVLWLNALATQQRLSIQGVESVPPLEFGGAELPAPSELAAVWRAVLEENWRSIFEPAVRVLEKAGGVHPRAAGEALALLLRAVERIELARLGPRINVGAELFPKLSDDRKTAAAFYTQPAAAELLAGLVIRPDALTADEWASAEIFRERRLADLACGTGTLLRAGYARVAALHERAGGTVESAAALHRGAMEAGLVGTDISPIAAHLTASSLAAVGAGEPYGDTDIGWVEVGGEVAVTGSLEYLGNTEVANLFAEVAGRSTGEREGEAGKHSVAVFDDSFDWILMNPPYSRTRGGQSAFDVAGLTGKERKDCQAKWRLLTRGEPVNNKAGMAASFLALARKKVKRGGRIGFVLPLTAAFADSWRVTRRMIEREFRDVVAVAVAGGRALGRDALSADTGMEEMLLAATRREEWRFSAKGEGDPAPIRCVTLLRPPARVGEAGEIARAIAAAVERAGDGGLAVKAGEEELGQVLAFDAGGEGAPWGPLGVTHADLALAAAALAEGRLDFGGTRAPFRVEMAPLDEVFEVGPTHHLIGHLRGREPIGAFEFHPVRSARDAIGRDRALWEANARAQRRLVLSPTHKGAAPAGVGSERRRTAMRRHQSDLHYARNMRWTSQALLAATTARPALGGSGWTALGHADARARRAFALWANSTLGMAVHWTRGQRAHAGRSRTQIGALRKTPCPRLDDLDEAALDRAAADFAELAERGDLLPACQAHADDLRKAIDEAALRLLGLPGSAAGAVGDLRLLWCGEPSVHGSNRAALRLLEREG